MTPALGAGPAGNLSQVAGGFFSETFTPAHCMPSLPGTAV